MKKIGPGDVVQLKSGGPRMTVGEERTRMSSPSQKHFECFWFVDQDNPRSAVFPEGALKLAPARRRA